MILWNMILHIYMHIADHINQKNFQEFSLANCENIEKYFCVKISNKKSAAS